MKAKVLFIALSLTAVAITFAPSASAVCVPAPPCCVEINDSDERDCTVHVGCSNGSCDPPPMPGPIWPMPGFGNIDDCRALIDRPFTGNIFTRTIACAVIW